MEHSKQWHTMKFKSELHMYQVQLNRKWETQYDYI